MQRLGGVVVDVDADEVDELARPHGPAGAVRHRLVEILGSHAGLVQHADAVVQERDQHPVDDEPGVSLQRTGCFPARSAQA